MEDGHTSVKHGTEITELRLWGGGGEVLGQT